MYCLRRLPSLACPAEGKILGVANTGAHLEGVKEDTALLWGLAGIRIHSPGVSQMV